MQLTGELLPTVPHKAPNSPLVQELVSIKLLPQGWPHYLPFAFPRTQNWVGGSWLTRSLQKAIAYLQSSNKNIRGKL